MDWEKKGGNMVIFNALEEFLRELELDKDAIDREIMRVTALYQQSQTVPLRYLYVVTTYKVKGELVKFQEHVGAMSGDSTTSRIRLPASAWLIFPTG
jgi:hypothetical protein